MFLEDRRSFLSESDFAVHCTTTSQRTNETRSFLALFDAKISDIAEYDRSFYDEKFYAAKVTGNKPVLTVISEDVGDIAINDTVTVEGKNYYFLFSEDDGTGFSFLYLSEERA